MIERFPDEDIPHEASTVDAPHVIIVGLGLGGLTAAIECRRSGCRVSCYEQAPELKPIGDSISIPHNAARIVKRWGNGSVDQELQSKICHILYMDILDSSGKLLVRSDMVGYGKGNGYPAHRGDLAMAFYGHAQSLGVEFTFGARVTEYWETEDEAGVVVNGERISADCVIGADGVRSAARGAITDTDPAPHASGYAVFRAWFDSDEVRNDPAARWILSEEGVFDPGYAFIGKDVHCLVGTAKLGGEVFWHLTHKDSTGVGESWSRLGDVDDAISYIRDWPALPKLEPIFRKTPKDRLIDFQLLWRDPLPTWVSKGRRMMVIGDAAHPFLPTSGQGAGQAMEDGATLAICLRKAGRERVKGALQATEMIRYRRATIMQRMGVETRDAWHKTDWEAVAKDTSVIDMPRPEWVFGHDCQKYAEEEAENVFQCIREGREYVPTNIPKNGEYHRSHDFNG